MLSIIRGYGTWVYAIEDYYLINSFSNVTGKGINALRPSGTPHQHNSGKRKYSGGMTILSLLVHAPRQFREAYSVTIRRIGKETG